MTQITLTQRMTRSHTPKLSFGRMLAVSRQRRSLARLDDAALTDLGLTRQEALAEARRAFWDIA